MFSADTPTLSTSTLPSTPANPPVYGSSTQKSGGSTTSTWAGTVLGGAQPQTTNKTLLGA